MRAFVDTNLLIRHFTGDPPAQAERATAFLGADHDLILPDMILAEMVYVLESYYEHPRSHVAEAARSSSTKRNVSTSPTRTFAPRQSCQVSGPSLPSTGRSIEWPPCAGSSPEAGPGAARRVRGTAL